MFSHALTGGSLQLTSDLQFSCTKRELVISLHRKCYTTVDILQQMRCMCSKQTLLRLFYGSN